MLANRILPCKYFVKNFTSLNFCSLAGALPAKNLRLAPIKFQIGLPMFLANDLSSGQRNHDATGLE